MLDDPSLQQSVRLVHSQLKAGLLEEAELVCKQILSGHPDQVETLVSFSVIRLRLDDAPGALAAADRAVALRPEAAETHNARGNACFRLGIYDDAIKCYEQAIAIRPDRASFHSNLGSALEFVGRLDDAIAAFDRAIVLQPGLNAAEANRLFALHFHPACGPTKLLHELREWAARVESALPGETAPHLNDRSLDRRLRIGYVSPDLRDHCLGRLMLPILREHNSVAVELFCYSDAPKADPTTEPFRACADGWRDTLGLSDEKLARQVRADEIDILVDLTLHMSGSRLTMFARKPAPVQVTYGGYPSGTGLRAIDYRLTDPYLDPPGVSDGWYAEQSIRLPDSFWCYVPVGPHLPVNPLPCEEAGFVTFGCLNNFMKVNDAALRLWAKVLKTVDRSRLLLLAPIGSARLRTIEAFRSHGVSPDRIEFVAHQPREAYLQTYHRIDIGLDTFPYNGHTTSLDSFWMGVPVVTLVGKTSVGRAGWSQLSNLGLTELAGQDQTQFVAIAAQLAEDRNRLRNLRQDLRPRMSHGPLTDPRRFARNMEAAHRQMWRRWCERDEQ